MNIGLAEKVGQNVLLKVKNIQKVFLLFQFYAINYEKAFRDHGPWTTENGSRIKDQGISLMTKENTRANKPTQVSLTIKNLK